MPMDLSLAAIGLNTQQNVLAQILGGAEFVSDMLYTAVPRVAAAGTTATFTRATTKTWANNDGYLVTGVAGEIGFVGARRVRNLLPSTEGAFDAGAGWTVLNGTVTPNVSDPNGGTSAYTLKQTGASSCELYPTTPFSGSVLSSVWIRRRTGTGPILLYGGDTLTYITASVTSEWQRIPSNPTKSSEVGFDLRLLDANDEVDFWHPQAEDITGRADGGAGGPSEYVSAGVASAPYYHGSMVDGVRAFPNDLSGNPIPSTTLLGYSAEGARTNYALWNRDLTNVAWTKTSCTAALTATGADNAANSASTLTATAGNATCLQSITRVSAQRVTGCKIKRRTGTGTINMTQDNGVTWTPVTVTSAYTNVAIPAATAANPIIGFQIVTNGDAIDVDFVMHEEAAFVSSSIATTTIAVARNADVLTYSSSGNIDGTKGWCYAEVAANWSASPTDPKAIAAFQSSIDYGLWYLTSANNLTLTDGAAAAGAEKSFTILPTAQKVAATWSSAANSSLGAAQGVVGSADTFGTAFTPDQIGVGIYRNGTVNGEVHWFGTIRNLRIGQRQLSSSELQAITQ